MSDSSCTRQRARSSTFIVSESLFPIRSHGEYYLKVPLRVLVESTSFISVLLRPCHSFAPLSPDKTCYRVILPAFVLRTQVHMCSRSSVQNHWHFEHYLQSLCLPVLDAVRNRTKIVPWSIPMSLFLWSTVWCSLLILTMRWPWIVALLPCVCWY